MGFDSIHSRRSVLPLLVRSRSSSSVWASNSSKVTRSLAAARRYSRVDALHPPIRRVSSVPHVQSHVPARSPPEPAPPNPAAEYCGAPSKPRAPQPLGIQARSVRTRLSAVAGRRGAHAIGIFAPVLMRNPRQQLTPARTGARTASRTDHPHEISARPLDQAPQHPSIHEVSRRRVRVRRYTLPWEFAARTRDARRVYQPIPHLLSRSKEEFSSDSCPPSTFQMRVGTRGACRVKAGR
jgi:hypothetical protein